MELLKLSVTVKFSSNFHACNISKSDYDDWTRFQVRAILFNFIFRAIYFKSEAKPRTGSKCEDLKSSPVRIGGFENEMTSRTNKSPLKSEVNFDPVQELN